ncbi:MAG TPA: MFS transporter [Flavisolibacter sp.]|nr:MFS transporter [Flavisolibacter sp.]
MSRQIWWLALVMFINRSGTMVIPFLTVYLTSKGYSIAQAGYVMAAFGCGSILGGYLGGKLTEKFGHYYVQVFSLLLNGILFIVLGQMQTLLQFTVCIFILSSLGESFRPANSAAIAAYSNESNRTRCYSLNRLAINLGWAIGPAVGGLLASMDYHLLFWADGLTCIFASLLFYFLFADARKTNSTTTSLPHEKIKTVSAYRDKTFLLGMFYIFLIGVCFFQMFNMVTVYFKQELHLQENVIGAVLALNGLIIAFVEMVLVYQLENRKDAVIYMTLGAFLIGLSFLAFNISPAFIFVLMQMIVVSFAEMLLFPFMNNFWVRRSNESNRGQYAAVYTMSFSAAIVLAPTFASQVATWLGFPVLWVVNFILCSFATLGFFLLKKRM